MKHRMLIVFILCSLVAGVLPLSAEIGFDWGFRERIRNTYMNNNADFSSADDKNDFFRFRTNLWGSMSYKAFTAKIQFTNEFRKYMIIPDGKKGDFTLDEIIIDNLYLNWTSQGSVPVSVTLGRQNLIYGEGFILLEGAPWDGSRAIYHDAIKMSFKLDNTTIDLLGIDNTQLEERLPAIPLGDLENSEGLPKNADGEQWMNDSHEQAFGIYAVQKREASQYEGYYFMKKEGPEAWIGSPPVNEDLTLHTLGGRALLPVAEDLKLTTEWAYQFGKRGDLSQSAYGGYAYLTYNLNSEKKMNVMGGFNLLSGDDPSTDDNEGWNPIFSRWPKWSELYIYSQVMESVRGTHKVAYWTNTFSPYVKYNVNVTPNVSMQACYYHLRALQDASFWNPNALSEGKTRGDEFQLLFKFKFTKCLSGHFLFDYFLPGDFYQQIDAGGSRIESNLENAVFIRGELMYTLP